MTHSPESGTTRVVLPRDAIIALVSAADRTRRAMSRALQPFELTLPQFNVLIILRREEELPTLQIAARLVEEVPGITRLVNTLAEKTYIRRRQCKEDRRQQLCSLTPAGRRIIDAVMPRIKETQEGLLATLSRSEAIQVVTLLDRVARPQGTQRA